MRDPVDQIVPKHLKKGAARKGHPGKCYEKAAQYVLCYPEHEEMWLVHGTVMVPEVPSVRYDHAWVEIGEEYVYDGAKGHFYGREDYFSSSRPVGDIRYTPHEMAALVARTNHYGPWSPGEASAD